MADTIDLCDSDGSSTENYDFVGEIINSGVEDDGDYYGADGVQCAEVQNNVRGNVERTNSQMTGSSRGESQRTDPQRTESQRTESQTTESQNSLPPSRSLPHLKPGECMKGIRVEMDQELLLWSEGATVRGALEAAGVTVRPSTHTGLTTVGWVRLPPPQLFTSDKEEREPHLLLVMRVEEFSELVRSRELAGKVRDARPPCTILTLILYGAAKYFKNQKNKKNTKWKNMMNQIETDNVESTQFSENDLEYYLTKLLLEESVSCTRAESPEELSQVILQFTKAVAEAPYKREKYLSDQEAEFYMRGDKRDSIKVDAQGNGLLRLWARSLTRLPGAGPEAARALAGQFPSPSALTRALQGPNTLAEVPVRREAAALSAPRRLGPELAARLVSYFTATDGDTPLS